MKRDGDHKNESQKAQKGGDLFHGTEPWRWLDRDFVRVRGHVDGEPDNHFVKGAGFSETNLFVDMEGNFESMLGLESLKKFLCG